LDSKEKEITSNHYRQRKETRSLGRMKAQAKKQKIRDTWIDPREIRS
jgi:hypothetical protein